MKGFLIFMVLVVGGAVYFLTHTHEMAVQALASIEKDEGPLDQSFTDQFRDPAAFSLKFKPMLHQRRLLVKVLPFVGESDTMTDIARNTQARYDESPLNTDLEYGGILLAYAAALEDQSNAMSAGMAFDLCKHYVANNPDSPLALEFKNIQTRLSYKYPSFR